MKDTFTLKVFSAADGSRLGTVTIERRPVEDGELAVVKVKGSRRLTIRAGRVYALARGVRVETLKGERFRVRRADVLGALVDYRSAEKKPKVKRAAIEWPDWIPG
jgi:hypothetical protein